MIKIYTKDKCVQCGFTKDEFRRRGIDFEEIDVTPELAIELQAQYGIASVPFVKVNEDSYWTGFRPDRIEEIANEVNNQ